MAVNAKKQENYEKSAEGTAKAVNELGAEIYKLNEKATALDSLGRSFDNLDKKIIKTKEDLEEMDSILEQAADKLSDEEKEVYNNLATNKQKREYLETIEQSAKDEANLKRNKIREKVDNMSSMERSRLLESGTTNADFLAAQSQIYAINNNELYEYIDLLKQDTDITETHAAAVEQLTQSILEEMSAEEA